MTEGFERLVIGPDVPDEQLALETNGHRQIPNYVAPAITDRERRKYELIRQRYGSFWRNRKPACGRYNCVGMAFASRRTSISTEEIDPLILKDDGYRLLSPHEFPKSGDLVIYRLAENPKEILHVAVVIHSTPGDGVALPAIWALSKWDDSMGEDIHLFNQVGHLDALGFKTSFLSERAEETL